MRKITQRLAKNLGSHIDDTIITEYKIWCQILNSELKIYIEYIY